MGFWDRGSLGVPVDGGAGGEDDPGVDLAGRSRVIEYPHLVVGEKPIGEMTADGARSTGDEDGSIAQRITHCSLPLGFVFYIDCYRFSAYIDGLTLLPVLDSVDSWCRR